MNNMIETYHTSFERAQVTFDRQLDTSDRSSLVLTSSAQASSEFMRAESHREKEGFVPVVIETESLSETAPLFVNRALLIHNTQLQALSPVIITDDPDHPGNYQITRFNQPYDPAVGFSAGMHWQTSLKAQTRVAGFGSHQHNEVTGHAQANPFEQGHFGAVILGVKSAEHGDDIISHGDGDSKVGTHGIIGRGIMEGMAELDLLPISSTTMPLPTHKRLQLYWHHGLEDVNRGPVGGDFPDATRLMIGAGILALGERGLDDAGRLVDHAVRGA